MFSAVGHCACHAQRRGDAAGAGQGHGPQARRLHGGHEPGARVTHAGRASVTHVDHALAQLQPLHHVLRGLGLVVLVHRQQLCGALVDAVGAQHGLRVARVFAGHGVGHLQHVQRAQGDVGQVADGRGHHIQGALGIMLRSRRFARGALG
ncbi:hypothetical protein D3C71_1136980 [compost metagenome]